MTFDLSAAWSVLSGQLIASWNLLVGNLALPFKIIEALFGIDIPYV